MSFETVEFNVQHGVARVVLNRPECLNSLNQIMLVELSEIADQCARDDAIKAVLLTGKGRAFCAGADLTVMNTDASESARRAQGRLVQQQMEQYFNPVISKLANLEKPVINAINGIAAGGGVGLALVGDIILAAESASFKQVFIPQLGIIPDLGSTWLVPKSVGRAKAMGMALLGESISAHQADQWGMIWKVLPDDQLVTQAEAMAQRLAKGPGLGMACLKQTMRAFDNNSLDQQLALEARVQLECCSSEDFLEGCLAFQEKRQPLFKGR
ncbi:MAG: 2-(1,2-epoxy-1,2-dihydrophenyl)acetyl-CoA isomerase PaaG [Candidatus Pelagadaptatus aseana]|uniref:enoyl-CoA hydratase-related protein n=1 Tax=Candidatus Pelagadaptatus aseana TaxID=3120508 RepID=UPI0039B1DE19